MQALFLSAIGRYAPWIAGVIVLLCIGLYGWHLHAALRSAQAALHSDKGTISQLEAVNSENQAALAQLTEAAAAWQTALTTASAADRHDSILAQQMLTTVVDAKAHTDAPVAPVLAGTLAAIARAQGGGK